MTDKTKDVVFLVGALLFSVAFACAWTVCILCWGDGSPACDMVRGFFSG